MATKQTNTFDAKAIAAELFACIGGLKAKLETIAKGIRSQDELDAVWVEFCKLAKGYSKGTLKVYKSLVKGYTSIPKQKQEKKPRAPKQEQEQEADDVEADTTTPRSTLRAWLAIVPALKAHKLPLAQLVADLEAAYAKA